MSRGQWITVLAFFSATATAGDWYEVGKVTKVHAGANGILYFSTQYMINGPSCQYGYQYAVSDSNNIIASRIYSLLMAAYMTSTSVSVYVGDTCLGSGFPAVTSVQIKEAGISH